MNITTYNEFLNDTTKDNDSMENLFGRLFQSRDTAHLNHLSTSSFAEHTALGAYYDNIIGIIDSLIECWQGHFKIVSIEIHGSKTCGSVEYFEKLLDEVVEMKERLDDDLSDIANIIDSVTNEITSLLYKLKNLK